ncbi:MAG TPA: glycosyl hydrolase family 65 protein [Caulobacteraceae bacterium]|jgi:trehalose/maltose hydrolase-like predicted phosphorylase
MTAAGAGVDAVRSGWRLTYDGFEPSAEGKREALCALGNGYFATRGAAPWARADGVRYPGVYLAGGYNRLRTRIGDREVENEDLVNLPNWLNLDLDIGRSGGFDERRVRLLNYRQELDLEHGLLLRTLSFEDDEGRRSTLRERRIVSMEQMHLAALEVTLTAENWSGTVAVRSGIDGRGVNAGAKLYARFSNRHLQPLESELIANDTVLLLTRTSGSGLVVAQAARTRVARNGEAVEPKGRPTLEPGYASLSFETPIAAGETLQIEKLAVLHTSRDRAIFEPSAAARKAIVKAGSFDQAHAAHSFAWEQLWRRFDIRMEVREGALKLDAQMLLRLNLFHLLQTASHNSIGLDIGVPARGWTGEAYQGHIFWDELFIFPTLVLRLPEITRSLLMYRYHRLDEARDAAANAGFRGAMFPWQSGSDGQETTQKANLNPRSERWVTDNSFRQRHVGAAVAWNVWQYEQMTDDRQFLQFYGAELFLEIARFWASVAQYNPARERYEIRGVMGPDEFHEGYPDAPPAGVDNNAYTNLMAAWVLWRALDVLDLVGEVRRAELMGRLGLSSEEVVRWDHISRRMYVPFHDDGLISQFEGYERLAELDWDAYRARYDNIQRLELILEAEGDSANRYKLGKQADVLMLFYLFSSDGLAALFDRLGYRFDREMIPRIADYYDNRCSHGSTLSRVVSAWVLARSDRRRAIGYLTQALLSDVEDIQGGTTAEGVHLGAMAATVDLVLRACTGIEARDDALRFSPRLPEGLERLDLSIRYRGHVLDLALAPDSFRVRSRSPGPAPFRLACGADEIDFPRGGEATFVLRRD